MSLIQRIDALLPQTQCGKCGHPGCRPYAEGLAAGEAINKCPPGGGETIAALARLLQVPVLELDAERGSAPAQVAYIREAECIGCTKCIQACPVDAIVGAAKLMHTVISSECSGCDLCVAPCPVDCIDLLPVSADSNVVPIVGGLARSAEALAAREHKRNQARRRFEQRNLRLQRDEARKQAERLARSQRAAPPSATPESAVVDDPIKAAIERVKAQKVAAADSALKQAKIAAAMSRAQLNKARTAFGDTPDPAQQAQLAELENAAQQAQARLQTLQPAVGDGR
ncbi:electron transport complex subunit RsxB [Pseudomonas sp. TNT2022 ID1025]|uniref:Electron transport complex subunit RsxB n=1 Tax=Pseudomonas rubra TaxID=2942627 RepID=A0ABT5PBW1_9PSED|nr:electron transport complex subunit RsxB [Pseudomonas rubra]MDD1015795.1 electron transport complex subunit RsxB [Pseudomonas rubra]MDD1036718.1 electron transport complex subunit RsxB [Pseudomonas rubra]MDD1157315.1 electron transport complex subunit RsxB [Pseudomonas rubra]